MKRSLLCWLVMMVFAGCSKDGVNSLVEIYSLKTFQWNNGHCQVNPGTAVLENQPLIRNEDIYAYSPNDYTFTISDAAAKKLWDLKDNSGFALTVNGDVVYYGIYKPGYSSSSCDNSITMSFSFGNQVYMNMGYAGTPPAGSVADDRNAPGLLLTLRRQKKLK